MQLFVRGILTHVVDVEPTESIAVIKVNETKILLSRIQVEMKVEVMSTLFSSIDAIPTTQANLSTNSFLIFFPE